jgi:hypothetical protein
MKAESGGQDEVRSIGLEQVGRTDISFETGRDQGDDVHESVYRFAAYFGKTRNLFEGEYICSIK